MKPFIIADKRLDPEPKAETKATIKRGKEGMLAVMHRWQRDKFTIGSMAQLCYGNDAHKVMDKVREALRSKGHTGSVMLWESKATAGDVVELIEEVFG